MHSIWEKTLIAENCSDYEAIMPIMNMRSMANTCNNCANYVEGQCSKDLFAEIENKIKFN